MASNILSTFHPVEYMYLNPELVDVTTVEEAYVSYTEFGSNAGLIASMARIPETFDPKIYALMNSNAIQNSTTIAPDIVTGLSGADLARLCSIHYLREATSNSVFQISPWFNEYLYRAFNQVTNIMTLEELYVDYASRTLNGEVVIGEFEDFRVLNENYRQANLNVRSNLIVHGDAIVVGSTKMSDLGVSGSISCDGPANYSNLSISQLITASNVLITGDTTVDGNVVTMNADIFSSRRIHIRNDTPDRPGFSVSQYYGNNVIAGFYENDEPVMVVRDEGFIGIRTGAPLYPLDVRGTVQAADMTLSNANGSTTFVNDATGMLAITAPRGITITDTNQTHIITLDAITGYVAIGTDTSETNLRVEGSAIITDDVGIGGSLTVAGFTVSQYQDIHAQGELLVDGSAAFGSNVAVAGTVTMASNLAVQGPVVTASTASITGAVQIGDMLHTQGYVGVGFPLAVEEEGQQQAPPGAFVTLNTIADAASECVWYDAVGSTKTSLLPDQTLVHTAPTAMQFVTPAASFTGTLDVTGAVTVRSNVSFIGSRTTWTGGAILVSGASAQIQGGSLSVSGDFTGSSNLALASNAAIEGSLALGGSAILRSNLDVTNVVRLRSNAVIDGTTNIKGVTTLNSNTIIGGSLSVSAGALFNTTLEAIGITRCGAALNVTGTATFSSNVRAIGTARLESNAIFSGTATFNSNVRVEGPANLNDTLTVEGTAMFNSNIGVMGPTRLYSNITVDGLAFYNSGLQVQGTTSLQSTLSVAGTASLNNTLTVAGATRVNNTLLVTGVTTYNSMVSINGTTNLKPLNVYGIATFGSNLVAEDHALFKDTVTVQGAAVFDCPATFNDAAVFSTSFQIAGGASMTSNLSVAGNCVFSSNLNVGGHLNVVDGATIGEVTTCTGTLNVYNDAIFDQAVLVRHGAIVQGVFNVDHDTYLQQIIVDDTAYFNCNVQIKGVATFSNQGLVSTGLAQLSNVNITGDILASGAALFNQMTVQGSLEVTGAISFSGNNIIDGDMTVTKGMRIGSNIVVGGTAVFSSNVFIDGPATVTGSASFGSDVSIIGALTVAGDASVIGTASADTFFMSSDERMKSEIREPSKEEMLAYLEKVRIRAYRFMDDPYEQYGVLGQEAESVHPALTTRSRRIIPIVGLSWNGAAISPTGDGFIGGGPLKVGDEFEFQFDGDRRILAIQSADGAVATSAPCRLVGRVIPDFVSVNTTQLVHALVVCVQSLMRD